MAELRKGIELLDDPDRRRFYFDWLEHAIRPMFGPRVLSVSEDVILRWLLLVREARKKGRTYPEPDLLLGAVALEAGMTLVTRNTADFESSGIPVFNPWTA
jgi:predicted nucleic acid-binding protein